MENEEEKEKGMVDKLPDQVSGGNAAGSGNLKLSYDPTKRISQHKSTESKKNIRYESKQEAWFLKKHLHHPNVH